MKATKSSSWPVLELPHRGLELSAVLQQALGSVKEQGTESFIFALSLAPLPVPSALELSMVEPDGEFWQGYQSMEFLPTDSAPFLPLHCSALLPCPCQVNSLTPFPEWMKEKLHRTN